jgi:acyl-coenzyme A synthetase/AMP-(fatty) acid ligase
VSEVIFHSSGSTGAAKKILRTDESLIADAAALVRGFPEIWGSSPVVVSSVRFEHMYGALWCVRAPKIAHSEVDPSLVASVEELSALCEKYGKVLFVTTPSFLEKALSHPDFPLLKGSFVSIVTSGSLLAKETSDAVLAAVGVSPFEIYGSTEAGSVAWRRRVDGDAWTLCPDVNAVPSSEGGLQVDSPFAMTRPIMMSDAVQFVSPRTFILGDRLDRRAKILEKYVSLAEIENIFKTHSFVSRVRVEVCSGAVARLGVLIVLSPEGVQALRNGTYGGLSARLRRDLLPLTGQMFFPRRIRFVRALPVNEQGKTTVSAVRATLDSWTQEPLVIDWFQGSGRLEAKLVFLSDNKCFKGHFPGCPILPGVAQLYFIRHFARQAFPAFGEALCLRRLKFQKVVVPGVEVVLKVTEVSDAAWEFSIAGENGLCTSGLWERTS